MPTEKKASQRDLTLVNILERLSNQLQQFEERLEEIEKNQLELPALFEKAGLKQSAAQGAAHVTGQIAGGEEIKKLHDAISRYRSDMLSLVNEQDRLNDEMKGLNKRQDAIVGAQEVISRDAASLDNRFGLQEKAIGDHSTFSVRQGEGLIKEIDTVNRNNAKLYVDMDKHLDAVEKDLENVNRNAAKLHLETGKRLDTLIRDVEGVNRNTAKLSLDTEKHIRDEQREIKRQIEDLRRDTTRRLLALDKIETTLEVLLIRTEPPEKKPFFLVRLFRKVGHLLGVKLPEAIKRARRRRSERS